MSLSRPPEEEPGNVIQVRTIHVQESKASRRVGRASRGLVISPTLAIGLDGTINGEFDPVSLRQYLLYWDRLDWPKNNIMNFVGDDAETQFLQSAGILERTMVSFSAVSGSPPLYVLLAMQVAALEQRHKGEPGAWSLAQHSDTLVSVTEGTVETRALEVELYSALPLPGPDVSFQDILEFKEKRTPELLRFRAAMDGLYQQVAAAADVPRAKITAIVEVQSALQDLHYVFGESFARRLLSSLKVELNLPNIAAIAVAGAAAAPQIGIPIALGAAAGTVAAAVRFDLAQIRKGKGIPDQLLDYAYLHQVVDELGVTIRPNPPNGRAK